MTCVLALSAVFALGDVPIEPTYYHLDRGILLEGGLPDLAQSDDAYMVLRPGVVINSNEPPIKLVLQANIEATPNTLGFRLESRSSTTNMRQRLELYDVMAQRWDTLDSRPATRIDTSIEIPDQETFRYMTPNSGTVLARISYQATGPILSYPWRIYIDQAVWLAHYQ